MPFRVSHVQGSADFYARCSRAPYKVDARIEPTTLAVPFAPRVTPAEQYLDDHGGEQVGTRILGDRTQHNTRQCLQGRVHGRNKGQDSIHTRGVGLLHPRRADTR